MRRLSKIRTRVPRSRCAPSQQSTKPQTPHSVPFSQSPDEGPYVQFALAPRSDHIYARVVILSHFGRFPKLRQFVTLGYGTGGVFLSKERLLLLDNVALLAWRRLGSGGRPGRVGLTPASDNWTTCKRKVDELEMQAPKVTKDR